MKRLLHSTCACIALAGLAVPAGAVDVVRYYNDEGKISSARGKITEETSKEVSITTTTKNELKIPINQIETINYDGQPPQLTLVDSAARAGKWEEAINGYKEAAATVDEKSQYLQGRLAFGAVHAQAMMAVNDPTHADEAIKALEKFNASFPDGRFTFQVAELLGQACLAKGEYAKAEKAFSTLKGSGWPGYAEKATVFQGVAALRQRKYPDAIISFDLVINAKGNDRETKQQRYAAMVYKGEALVQSGKAPDAEKLLREALEQIPRESVEVKAIGHNALGDALRAAKKQPKEVLLDGYMWVVAVYDRNAEQLARSLFNSAQLFDELKRKDDAERMRARLKEEFPNSPWAKKLGSS